MFVDYSLVSHLWFRSSAWRYTCLQSENWAGNWESVPSKSWHLCPSSKTGKRWNRNGPFFTAAYFQIIQDSGGAGRCAEEQWLAEHTCCCLSQCEVEVKSIHFTSVRLQTVDWLLPSYLKPDEEVRKGWVAPPPHWAENDNCFLLSYHNLFRERERELD